MVKKICTWAIEYRHVTLGIIGLITVFFCFQIKNMVIKTELTDLYPPNHPFIKIHEKYKDQLKPEGILLTDRDLVRMDEQKDHFSIPATRIAEDLGRKMMANIIMLGFSIAITGLISVKAAREAVKSSVPPGTDKLNLTAFGKGFDYGMAKLKGRQKKASGRSEVSI